MSDNIEAKIEFVKEKNVNNNIIKVIGVGGGGTNAVNYMHNKNIKGVDLIVCNTDKQSLINSPILNKIQLSKDLTEGLGAGENPKFAEQAAINTIDEIKDTILLKGTKMVFIVAGMGKGTGTGASPIIAKISKDAGILTIGVITKPFEWEGPEKKKRYSIGIKNLEKNVDAMVIIDNNRLNQIYSNLSYEESYRKVDQVLMESVVCISKIINYNFKQNVDFKDINTILKDSGTVIIGEGVGSGDNRSIEAIEQALKSPLLVNNNINSAKNILILVTEREDEGIKVKEMKQIMTYVQKQADEHNTNSANIIQGWGKDIESKLDKGQIGVSIIASSFGRIKDGDREVISLDNKNNRLDDKKRTDDENKSNDYVKDENKSEVYRLF